MIVERFFLLLHELDMHRQHIDVLAHFLAQTFGSLQAGGILLGGNDTLG